MQLRKLKYIQRYKLRYYFLLCLGWFDYIAFHSHKNPETNKNISKWKYNLFLDYARKSVRSC